MSAGSSITSSTGTPDKMHGGHAAPHACQASHCPNCTSARKSGQHTSHLVSVRHCIGGIWLHRCTNSTTANVKSMFGHRPKTQSAEHAWYLQQHNACSTNEDGMMSDMTDTNYKCMDI